MEHVIRILIATIPSDSHSWNLVLLQKLLEEKGHQVINLGPCTPIPVIIKETLNNKPDGILISSVNGHALHEAKQLAKAINKNTFCKNYTLIIGGKLTTNGCLTAKEHRALIAVGYKYICSNVPASKSLDDALRVLSQRRAS